jgi:hypothetical protein
MLTASNKGVWYGWIFNQELQTAMDCSGQWSPNINLLLFFQKHPELYPEWLKTGPRGERIYAYYGGTRLERSDELFVHRSHWENGNVVSTVRPFLTPLYPDNHKILWLYQV